MAVTQYIGARYVPKFYEGVEWTANTQYEPLTIVTRNGNSYTSKKPVPANIGAPENNAEYWASTGIYNQQVEEYRQEVEELSGRVDDIEDNLSLINNRRFLFIGDSWFRYHSGSDYTHFMDMVYSALNLTQGTDYYEIASGGYGFIGDEGLGRSWQSLLESRTDITSPETITDIYVFGGVNDRTYSINQIESAISNFCTYAKNRFPNAEIKIGCYSWTRRSDFNGIIRDVIIPAYRSCGKYGAKYISNMEYSNHIYGWLEGIHPTQAMQQNLFANVMNAIINDRTDVKLCSAGSSRESGATGNVPTATFEMIEGWTLNGQYSWDNNIVMNIDNGICEISCGQGCLFDLTANNNLGDRYQKIATVRNGLIFGKASGKGVHIPISCFVDNATGRYHLAGYLLLCNGEMSGTAELYIRLNIAATVTTAIKILEFSASFPTLCC